MIAIKTVTFITRFFVSFFMVLLLVFAAGCAPSVKGTEIRTETPTPVLQPEKTDAPTRNKYTVNMEFFPETREVSGILKLNYINTTGTDREFIYFNIYPNAFSQENKTDPPFFEEFKHQVYKYGEDYGYFNILNISIDNEDMPFETDKTILGIKLSEPIGSGQGLEVTLNFQAKIPKICHRIGSNGEEAWFGNFIPTLCVYDVNGWNIEKYSKAGQPYYSETADYTVNITTPKEYTVIGSGQADAKETEGKKITSFNESMIRDFAFVIGKNYEKQTIMTSSGVEINFYHYSDIGRADKYFEVMKKTLNYFGEKVATYPYGTLNVVETEMFFKGGIDYPQIIFIDSEHLKQEDAIITLSFLTGHQWFYNIIGTTQTKSSWIDNGLTVFLNRGMFYDRNRLLDLMVDDYNYLLSAETRDRKLDTPIRQYKSWEDYHNIQYKKARLMMFALESKMGYEKFNMFLKEYYTKYSFKIASKEDFIEITEKVYGGSLEDFFLDWILEEELPPLL